ncbi:dihydrodipicolinate synthase family protein [Thermomicrobiaceae bacterium CFH 74404]|uniref:Dihydrodipicolinate synthase family protein n=1 Tax=Thermalbibacter longus TaxID=2951981 RepID=A0AA41WBI0_9BACT|nr:dihydrodipicolinate synthase family protein [Thermalbibacter longus]MCM8749652.1 dihydrodipicolinate synthase family protein [Thermalbibacter longus]
MASQMRGVYVILCTPFDEGGALDEESLRRQIRFCLDAGVHGVVGPANASEFWTLTDEERRRFARIMVEEVAGRVPTVVGVTAGSAQAAVELARHAQQIGASAVMAMPPHARPVPPAALWDYYRALAEAVAIPIFIQNHDAPLGTRLGPEFIARLVSEIDHAWYVKEETLPPGRAISALLEQAGQRLQGVMGGIGGRYLLDEYRRGACGTMPACQMADVHVRIWEALEAGDERTARDLHARLLPLLNYEALHGVAMYKEVLRRWGVIRTNYLRSVAGNPLDAFDLRELDALLSEIEPLLHGTVAR